MRCSRMWWTSVVISRAPEPPSGWPSAIAPPFGSTVFMSAPVSISQALTTVANASLTSIAPISSSRSPERASAFAVAGIGPVTILTGPIPATAKALARSGLRLDEIGAIEVNEAFATVVKAWEIETGADMKTVNPNGGAIALGHPLGGSGARLMTTLVHHMWEHRIRYGLQTMCEGGGMANATILELL